MSSVAQSSVTAAQWGRLLRARKSHPRWERTAPDTGGEGDRAGAGTGR